MADHSEAGASVFELYDLGDDPSDQSNLVGEKPALVTELYGLLEAWIRSQLARSEVAAGAPPGR